MLPSFFCSQDSGFNVSLKFYVSVMQDTLNNIFSESEAGLAAVKTRADFDVVKAKIVGPKGSFTQVQKGMGKIPPEERPAMGKLINEMRMKIDALFAFTLEKIVDAELSSKVGPAVDVSLPSPDIEAGNLHPLELVRQEIVRVFRKIGFTVAEGTEIETEYYSFDALNTPPEHPARSNQDTYYFSPERMFANVIKHGAEPERYMLRPHTSSVQIRTMYGEKPPLRIISPGRCFRRDTADATHSASFHQVEGLYVDKNVTVADLKAVLDYLIKELLGKDAKTRFRPHFFPYTEPSFEVDFSSAHLAKLGKEWVEILGCGVVDPKVFEAVGYSDVTGFAFGMGIERIAMILYGVDDIRYFYQNDARFLRQFA